MSATLSFPEAVPELTGAAVVLRELTEADIPAWFERATDVESADLAGDPVPESIELGTAWLKRHRDRFCQQAAIRWAIVPKGHTKSVGTVGLAIASKEHRMADLGIVVARAYWKRGLGTSATQLVTGYAFGTLEVAEIQAEVLKRNLASVRLLEKAGFRLLRAVAAGMQSGCGAKDGCLYVLHSPHQSAGLSPAWLKQ
jgi:[ribosomal protein S5]-alanine N-acetyltransferase